MKPPRLLWLSVTVTTFLVAGIVAGGETSKSATNDAFVKRGQYLAEQVAICADCHTARDWKGTPNRTSWLQGAKLDFKPTRSMPWAEFAPAIAGLPGFSTDEQGLKYFETGVNATGKRSSPPMPQYRFAREDALAIVAYLRSLPPLKK